MNHFIVFENKPSVKCLKKTNDDLFYTILNIIKTGKDIRNQEISPRPAQNTTTCIYAH